MNRSSLTLLTPTYHRDLDRFALQRESIERCAIDLPHLAIVNTEDLPLFQKIPFKKNLTLLTTRDVLGKTMDRRRQVWRVSRKDYRYWITPAGIPGWLAQQLLKLAAPAFISTDSFLCLDSDAFFVDHLTAADFHAPDGRLHLYETSDDLDLEMAEWYAHSLRFLGIKETGVPLRRFTHAPVPMHCQLVKDMQTLIEQRHHMPWMEAIITGDRIMEYTTYGAYARHVDQLKTVAPIAPQIALYYWWKHETENLLENLDARLAASRAKIILINSNIGLSHDECRRAAHRAWERTPHASHRPEPALIS
ncbi:MAG TPA: DUF6492 family protein [Phycisphaerae bacterium]|nr:DUF6492 family protein [Phycisphaerae bacterium]